MSGSHEMIVEGGGSVVLQIFDVDEVRVGDRGSRSRCPKAN